jgi:hypothetical protein
LQVTRANSTGQRLGCMAVSAPIILCVAMLGHLAVVIAQGCMRVQHLRVPILAIMGRRIGRFPLIETRV